MNEALKDYTKSKNNSENDHQEEIHGVYALSYLIYQPLQDSSVNGTGKKMGELLSRHF